MLGQCLVRWVAFSDHWYRGREFNDEMGERTMVHSSNKQGAALAIDNFALSREPSGSSFAFEWSRLTDPSGIELYSWVLDRNATTKPVEPKGLPFKAVFENLEEGDWFLHVRARDGAGNWGRTAHFPFQAAGLEDELDDLDLEEEE